MSKENDDYFASVKECVSCGCKKLYIEVTGKREVLYCLDCGFPNAGQPVGE